MSGTIREVVSFAAPDEAENEERLRRALQIACAEEFVSELDRGVETLLGERGTGLSEGQMQRLAVARAVFSGSPILLPFLPFYRLFRGLILRKRKLKAELEALAASSDGTR